MRGGLAWSRARWAAAAVAALAYAGGLPRTHDAGTGLPLVPGSSSSGRWWCWGAAAAWGAGHRALAVAAASLVLLLALQAASGHGVPSRWLYLAQHAGAHLALAAWFGSTLRRGGEPLVSALARRVHGNFTPAMAATRAT
jgi:hypothetical protein